VSNHLIFGLLGLALLWGCRQESTTTVRPERRDVTEAVYAAASVQPAEHYQVFPETGGVITERKIELGDTVRKGQLLFRLRNTTAELQTRSARLNYELAREELSGQANQLAELERQRELARQQVRQDSLDLARQRELWAQNIGSRRQVEQFELALASSRTQYQNASDALVQARRRLANQARVARTQLDINQENADRFIISSQLAGRVYDLRAEAGELVGPQQSLAMIGSLDSFILVMQVDEADIGRVHLGQTVYVRLDSYRDTIVQARVSRINPSMDTRTQTFSVEAAFAEDTPALYPNLSAEANIVIRTRENALVIPRSLLLPGDSVRLADGSTVAVTSGVRDLRYVEILEGLSPTTELRGESPAN
jgi:multidrug efflux pump subunit AcrA (membrane-fusion protein)